MHYVGNKGKKALLGGISGLAREERRSHAHQRAVAAVHLDGIGDQVVFGPVFTGNPPAMGPVPVQDELAAISLGDDIPVGWKWRLPRNRKRDAAGFDGGPSRSGKAVLRRVHCVSSTLAGEVGDEQIDVGKPLVRIRKQAQEKVARPKDLKGIFVYGDVGARPFSDSPREGLQSKARRKRAMEPLRAWLLCPAILRQSGHAKHTRAAGRRRR